MQPTPLVGKRSLELDTMDNGKATPFNDGHVTSDSQVGLDMGMDGDAHMMMNGSCDGPIDDEDVEAITKALKKPDPITCRPVRLPKEFVQATLSPRCIPLYFSEIVKKMRVDLVRESEPIFWECMLKDAHDDSHMFKHCQADILQQLQTKCSGFYIGITHDVDFRWSNTEFGHKWNRDHRFKAMRILLKNEPSVIRSMETRLIKSIYENARLRPSIYENARLRHLIINCEDSPPGAVVGNEEGKSFLYLCLA